MAKYIGFGLNTDPQRYRAFSPDFASPIVTDLYGETLVFPTMNHLFFAGVSDTPEYIERIIGCWTIKDLIFTQSDRGLSWLRDKKGVDVKRRKDWDEQGRTEWMEKCQVMKYEQNPGLRKLLLDTGDTELVFVTQYDNDFCYEFGTGKGIDGKGKERLSRHLTKLRDSLRKARA